MTTYQRILKNKSYSKYGDKKVIRTIDMHTGGEALRVILDGFPELEGSSVLEYRNYCKTNLDQLRTSLMFEPRGHADMYGCILSPPNDDDADFGIIFLHNEGYSTMCGHAIIAISTLAVEMKWIDIEEGENKIKIDAPCGRITSFVKVENAKVSGVRFLNVPSFVVGLNREVNVPGFGKVIYDLAYGGAYYAFIDLSKNNFNFDLKEKDYQDLILAGRKIKAVVQQNDTDIIHPFENDLSFLYGCIFIGEAENPENDSRNVCIFADGELDRCPTGSGVSGRMAIHYSRDEIEVGQSMKIESIVGSVFEASVHDSEDYGPYKAVIPEVKGNAYITGQHQFIIDPDDRLNNGFFLK